MWRPAGGLAHTDGPVLSHHLTDPAPDRQPPAAPLQPLAPADPTLTLIASVAREAWMRDGRIFKSILRSADGSDGWHTLHRCLDPEAVAVLVMGGPLDPLPWLPKWAEDWAREWIIGLAMRHHVRLVAIDLDNHHGVQNWHPDSPRLTALVAAAEAAGVVPSLHRTTNGMHLWMALPEAAPIVSAHWQMRELLRRAEIDPVEVELFPSLDSGSTITDAKARPESKAIRLPGQAGSALRVGDRWVDEPVLIWQQLEADLELAEVCPEWQELLEAAATLERQNKRLCRGFPSRPRASRRPGGDAPIEWTGTGESNRHLGALANRGYRDGHHDRESLAAYIEAAALAAPGFDRWASLDTKRELAGKARDWAKSCIARPPLAKCRPQSNDPNHNDREKARCVAKVASAAARFGRRLGDKAMAWSERKASEAIGITRQTFRKLKPLWRVRLLAACYASRSVAGTHPSPKGGAHPAVVSVESINPFPPGTADPARCPSDHHCRPPSTADPPPLPTLAATVALHSWQAAQRSREREELARWLGAAA